VRTRGESCGGEVTCVVRNCAKGLGNPVFDKLEAELAKAMMSLPATKVGLRHAGGGHLLHSCWGSGRSVEVFHSC
jgi:chorismate synthase